MHDIGSSRGTHYSKSIAVLQYYRVILYVLRWFFACLLVALGLTFIARVVTGYTVLDYLLNFLLFANVLAFGFWVPGSIHETEHLFAAIRLDFKIKYFVVRIPFGIQGIGEDIEEVDVAKKESYYERLFDVAAAPYVSIACNIASFVLLVILLIVACKSPCPLNVILFFLAICGHVLYWMTPVAVTLALKRKRSNRYLLRMAAFLSSECYLMERIMLNDMVTLAKFREKALKEVDRTNRMIASGRLVAFGHIASIPVYVPSKFLGAKGSFEYVTDMEG